MHASVDPGWLSHFIKFLIRYPIEFILFLYFFILFKILPLSLARHLGSLIATSIGPLLPVHGIAEKNLKIAFPDKENEWRRKILKKIWHNFGCIMAEYSHLKEILKNVVTMGMPKVDTPRGPRKKSHFFF